MVLDKINLCEKLKKSIRKIIVLDGNQIISSGTGVLVDINGTLLTANHIITDYEKLSKPRIITLAASGVGNVPKQEYTPILFNSRLDIGMPNFTNPLEIDLAVLKPIEKITETLIFIEFEDKIASEGEDVLMVGFPDEVKPPLHFDKMLNFCNPDLKQSKESIEDFFNHFMCLVMFKSGIVGSTHKINLDLKSNIPNISGNICVQGAEYWIDNASTYGASGGPVVNTEGKLIGIICEKGTTSALDGKSAIPSGSTMALSHKLITWSLK